MVSPYRSLVLGSDSLAEVFRIVRLDKHKLVAKAAHRHAELREGSAVECAGGNDLVARSGNRCQSEKLRCLAACEG